MNIENVPVAPQEQDAVPVGYASRRRFFQLAGGIAGAGLLLASCRRSPATDVYIGADDIGLLNYLYIVQQIEAAFYTQLVATPYYGLTVSESQCFTDLRDQEIAHREFLKTLLDRAVIPNISINFTMVTFADRTSVLDRAFQIEDLATSAINGAVKLFKDQKYALAMSKMASVEARHSAYSRDILTHNTFAGNTAVAANGLEMAVAPAVGFELARAYTYTRFDATRLPTW